GSGEIHGKSAGSIRHYEVIHVNKNQPTKGVVQA
ncbi:MAG: hypothetical protein ACJAUL_003131, partial [Paraglaciecola sp.]